MAGEYRKTSGRFLIDYMRDTAEGNEALRVRLALAGDVYIKQWSFALLNRICLILALILSALVLMWPVVGTKIATQFVLADSSVLQTAITTAAAASIYGYQYYKRRQAATENLLRAIVFGAQDVRALAKAVIAEMGRIDTGFDFKAQSEAEEPDEDAKTG